MERELGQDRIKAIVCAIWGLAALCGLAGNITLSPISHTASLNGARPPNGSYQWVVEDGGSTLYSVRQCVYTYHDEDFVTYGYEDVSGSFTIPHVVSGYYGDEYRAYTITRVENKYSKSPYKDLTSVTVSEGITALDKTFSYCQDLASVSLPSTLNNLGTSTFAGCYSLKSVSLPNAITEIGDYSFYSCTNLVSVSMPTQLQRIGDRAFQNSKIAFVSLPNGCTDIGQRAFSGCFNLQSLNLGRCQSIQDEAFKSCVLLSDVDIPASVESVGDDVFYNCTGLRHVGFSEGTRAVGSSAFYGCSGLQEIVLPKGLEVIGAKAFQYCSSAKKICIPNSVTNVGYQAFYNCEPTDLTMGALWTLTYSSVTNLVLLPGSAAIGNSAFSSCKALERIELPATIVSIGSNAFNGCTNLVEAIIPDSVEVVSTAAFSNCSRLKKLPLLNGSVTNWGNQVFYSCSAVDRVVVPGNIKSIPNLMFANCTNLKEIVVGEGVETISYNAFNGDNAVEMLSLPSTATNFNNATIIDAANLKVVTFHQLHPPRYVTTAVLKNFAGMAYYPPEFADEWQIALGTFAAFGKSWAQIEEGDPGSVKIGNVEVPYSWLGKYRLTSAGLTPLAAATTHTGKRDLSGRELTALDDFIAGTDPTDANSRFIAKITINDGVPVILYEPDLNTNGAVRVYTIYGKASLADGWTSPTNATHRFFIVDVSMP